MTSEIKHGKALVSALQDAGHKDLASELARRVISLEDGTPEPVVEGTGDPDADHGVWLGQVLRAHDAAKSNTGTVSADDEPTADEQAFLRGLFG